MGIEHKRWNWQKRDLSPCNISQGPEHCVYTEIKKKIYKTWYASDWNETWALVICHNVQKIYISWHLQMNLEHMTWNLLNWERIPCIILQGPENSVYTEIQKKKNSRKHDMKFTEMRSEPLYISQGPENLVHTEIKGEKKNLENMICNLLTSDLNN